MSKTISIHYEQTLTYDGPERRPSWSETLDISVRLYTELVTSGWLRKHFAYRGGHTDFVVLQVITLHCHPLHGKELEELVQLGVATRRDEGRMFTWVSDVGLADEIGIARQTVAAAAKRLAEAKFINILNVPEDRRYGGRFAGKLYALAGASERFMEKEVTAKPRSGLTDRAEPLEKQALSHRVSSSNTVEPPPEQTDTHRAELGGTATPHKQANTHRVSSPNTVKASKKQASAHRVSSGNTVDAPKNGAKTPAMLAHASNHGPELTQILEDVKEEEERAATDFETQVLTYLLKQGGVTSEKDAQTLSKLVTRGCTLPHIHAAIDEAATRQAAGQIRVFNLAYCATIALNGKRTSDVGPSGSGKAAVRLSPIRNTAVEPSLAASVPAAVSVTDPELKRALQACEAAGYTFRPAQAARLQALADEFDAPAQRAGATGAQWLARALRESIGAARENGDRGNIVTYAANKVRAWLAQGGPDVVKPAPTAPLSTTSSVTRAKPTSAGDARSRTRAALAKALAVAQAKEAQPEAEK